LDFSTEKAVDRSICIISATLMARFFQVYVAERAASVDYKTFPYEEPHPSSIWERSHIK